MTSDCAWWCEKDMGQAVFSCFKAGVLWAFSWRDWENPRIASVRIQSAGRDSKLGYLEYEVLLRSTTLKNYTFQAVSYGEMQSYCCGNTTWNYKCWSHVRLIVTDAVAQCIFWFTMDENTWMSDVSSKFVQVDCSTTLLRLALFCQSNVTSISVFPFEATDRWLQFVRSESREFVTAGWRSRLYRH